MALEPRSRTSKRGSWGPCLVSWRLSLDARWETWLIFLGEGKIFFRKTTWLAVLGKEDFFHLSNQKTNQKTMSDIAGSDLVRSFLLNEELSFRTPRILKIMEGSLGFPTQQPVACQQRPPVLREWWFLSVSWCERKTTPFFFWGGGFFKKFGFCGMSI